MQHAHAHFFIAKLAERDTNGFRATLHIGLHHNGNFLLLTRLDAGQHIGQAATAGTCGGGRLVTQLALTEFGNFPRAGFVFNGDEILARCRHAGQAQDFNRQGRPGIFQRSALIIQHGAHPAPFGTGHHNVTLLQRALLHQHRRHRTPAAIELAFNDGAFRSTVRIGAQIQDFRLQRNRFQQLIQIDLLGCRNLDFLGFAAQAFHHDFVLQQFLLHAFGLHAGLINLIDRDNQRHLGRAGMADGFHRLRHDTIISGDNQHHHIGHRCTTRAHGGEGFMARRINEGHAIPGGDRDLIGANMLGDATRFMGDNIGLAQRVQKAGFAVIHMAHNGDHRRTRQQFRIRILCAFKAHFDISFADALHPVAEFLHDQFGRIGINALRQRRHNAHAEEAFHHIPTTGSHTIGQFLHGDAFRHHHIAHHAFRTGTQTRQFLLAPFTFTRTPDRRDGTRAFILAFQRSRHIDAAFAAPICPGRGFLHRRWRQALGGSCRRARAPHGRAAWPFLIIIGWRTRLERQLHRRF